MKDDKHYLSRRVAAFCLIAPAWAVLLALFAYLTGRFPGRFGFWGWALVIITGASLPALAYYWIYRPYCRCRDTVRRFIEGYISVHELRELTSAVSPETDRFIAVIDGAMASMRNLDLSKRQAQYRALQNQINPHFLYNTLEGIRSEALIAGLDSLADMTEALAAFFRYTISKVENLVTVEEELENCRTYFKIQQYRFGSRLRMRVHIDPEDEREILRCLIPKLTLQPILENSIIHGIELKLGEGHIDIEISRSQRRLLISVRDDGVGMDREALRRLNGRLGSKEEELRDMTHEAQGGIALTNVNNRIHLIFGEEYGMHVYSVEGEETTVELTIPAMTEEGRAAGGEGGT